MHPTFTPTKKIPIRSKIGRRGTMAPLRRRLLNLLTGLSLLLCLATAALWVRGCWALDCLTVERAHYRPVPGDEYAPYRSVLLQASRGTVECVLKRSTNLREWGEDHPEGIHAAWSSRGAGPVSDWRFGVYSIEDERTWFDHFGFACATGTQHGLYAASIDFELTSVSAPTWFVALVTGLLPAARGWRWALRRRRAAAGRCPRCGYDLRATPDRCPECGSVTSARG